jgi:hypothetical protein
MVRRVSIRTGRLAPRRLSRQPYDLHRMWDDLDLLGMQPELRTVPGRCRVAGEAHCRRVPLSDPADPATVAVSVAEPEGTLVVPALGADRVLDPYATAVVFTGTGYWPPPGSEVEITYTATP